MSLHLDIQSLLKKFNEINLILLIPHGRAGSFFLQSLFDGHPTIVTFPSYFRDYGWNLKQANENPAEFVNEFCKVHAPFFDSSVSYIADKDWVTPALLGPNKDEHLHVDLEVYRNHFLKLLKAIQQKEIITNRHVLIAAHLSLATTLQQDITPIRYILFHQHGGNSYSPFLDRLLNDFPNLYFIAMTRDLRESWLSFKTLLAGRWGKQNFFNFFIRYIRLNLSLFNELLSQHGRFLPGHIKIVNLNRLHELQDRGMDSLANWLDIPFVPQLTHSSFLGKTWWGNATDGKPLDGFSRAKSLYQWPTRLSLREIEIIEYLSAYLCKPFGFPEARTHMKSMSFYRNLLFPYPLFNFPRLSSMAVKKTMESPARTIQKTLKIVSDFIYLPAKSFVFFLSRYSMSQILNMERVKKHFSGPYRPIDKDSFLT